TWKIIPKSVLYTSLDSATAIKFSDRLEIIPGSVKLFQNYPNPFNPETTIKYQLSMTNYVDLAVYNLLGQKVVALVNKEQQAGEYKLKWNGIDQFNRQVSSGIYILRISTNNRNKTQKMVLIR
ncbi:MAG: T9SS type A sorting domain-containing protein, partial [Calditrichales bacterium]|nr:T9SS type A sorting domain-containing protein [Calditrichales bacterium]